MNQQIETVKKLSKGNFDATAKAFGIASAGTQAIVVDTADYARKSFEQGAATLAPDAGIPRMTNRFRPIYCASHKFR